MKLTNIDQILTLSTVLPKENDQPSERQLNYLLLLNTFLNAILPLCDLLENVDNKIFKDLVAVLKDTGFEELKELIDKVINDDIQPRRNQQCNINQRCFAVKSGINKILDLLRKCYSERVNDVLGNNVIVFRRISKITTSNSQSTSRNWETNTIYC